MRIGKQPIEERQKSQHVGKRGRVVVVGDSDAHDYAVVQSRQSPGFPERDISLKSSVGDEEDAESQSGNKQT